MGYGPIERKPGIGRIAGHSVDIIGDQGEVPQDTGGRGAWDQASWPRTLASRRTRGASWRPSRRQAVTGKSSGQKTLASWMDCPAKASVWGTLALDPRCVHTRKESVKNSFIPQVPLRLAPNLASNAVPKFQLLQAVATCSPHLMRSPVPPLVQDQRAVLLCM